MSLKIFSSIPITLDIKFDEKDKQRDASFNEHKLAEDLVNEIKKKGKVQGEQTVKSGASSYREKMLGAANKQIAAKPNTSEGHKRPSHNRDNSLDSQFRPQKSPLKENRDESMHTKNQKGKHQPVLKNNYYQQHPSTYKPNDDSMISNQEKSSQNKQLRVKLRDMVQNSKIPEDYVDSSTGFSTNMKNRSYKENSFRHFKKPKDLSLTNDGCDDSIRSDVKSIGNATSMNPNILDELMSVNSQRYPDTSFYPTSKDDIGILFL